MKIAPAQTPGRPDQRPACPPAPAPGGSALAARTLAGRGSLFPCHPACLGRAILAMGGAGGCFGGTIAGLAIGFTALARRLAGPLGFAIGLLDGGQLILGGA